MENAEIKALLQEKLGAVIALLKSGASGRIRANFVWSIGTTLLRPGWAGEFSIPMKRVLQSFEEVDQVITDTNSLVSETDRIAALCDCYLSSEVVPTELLELDPFSSKYYSVCKEFLLKSPVCGVTRQLKTKRRPISYRVAKRRDMSRKSTGIWIVEHSVTSSSPQVTFSKY